MFLFTAFAIVFIMHYVAVAWTCLNTPFLSFNLFAKILPIFMTLFFFAAFIVPHQVHNDFTYILQITANSWLGVLFLYFITVMAAMLLQLIFKLIGHPITFSLGPLVILAALVLTSVGVSRALKEPKITELTITTETPGTDGIKIVQVSDTHFGATVTPSRAAKLTKQINALEPDLILFTGDIFEDTGRYTPLFVENVKAMKAKLGKFGVTGNHEYYGGIMKNMDLFREAGITPLQNKTVQAGKINIVGINDILSSGIKPQYFEEIIRAGTVSNNNYNLLLSHTPLYLEEAANNKIDLMLSGHTHNGQIWPFKYLTGLRFKNLYGLYKKGKTNLYVTSGAFYWGPALRLGTKNELPVITLKEAEK